MSSKRIKITRTTIDKLATGDRDGFIWDSDARGLGVKVSPTQAKRWIFQYHLNGRDRRMTLGDATSMAPHDARKLAIRYYAAVREGICPASSKYKARAAPKMSELFDKFMDEHSRLNNKPSTVQANEGRIKTNLNPYFGHLRVDEVTTEHINAFKVHMGEKHTTFNRCRSLLRTAFKLAINRWGWRINDPCAGVTKHTEYENDRILSTAELKKVVGGLNAALDTQRRYVHSTSAIDALRLLACQGFRVGEIRTCKWEHIDWDRSEMLLPDSKTGRRVIPLGRVTMAVLHDIKRYSAKRDLTSDYICPSPIDPDRPISYRPIKDALDRITSQLNIEAVTTHRFRATVATASAELTNDIIGLRDLFGWKSLAMPNKYIKRAGKNARKAANLQEEFLPAELWPKELRTDERDVFHPSAVVKANRNAPSI